jgi:hypothetical protein
VTLLETDRANHASGPHVRACARGAFEEHAIEVGTVDLEAAWMRAAKGLNPAVVAAPPHGVAGRGIEARRVDGTENASPIEELACAGRDGFRQALGAAGAIARLAGRRLALVQDDRTVTPRRQQSARYGPSRAAADDDNGRIHQGKTVGLL